MRDPRIDCTSGFLLHTVYHCDCTMKQFRRWAAPCGLSPGGGWRRLYPVGTTYDNSPAVYDSQIARSSNESFSPTRAALNLDLLVLSRDYFVDELRSNRGCRGNRVCVFEMEQSQNLGRPSIAVSQTNAAMERPAAAYLHHNSVNPMPLASPDSGCAAQRVGRSRKMWYHRNPFSVCLWSLVGHCCACQRWWRRRRLLHGVVGQFMGFVDVLVRGATWRRVVDARCGFGAVAAGLDSVHTPVTAGE